MGKRIEVIRTVIHIATGHAWFVAGATYRPDLPERQAAGLHGTTLEAGGFTPCSGCGRFVGLGGGTVTVNGNAFAIMAAAMDRAVNDLPAFVTDGPVAYVPEAVIITCTDCNGTPSKRANFRPELEAAALRRLHRYGKRA